MTGQHIHLMEEQLFTSFSCRSGRGLMLRTCPAKQVLHVTVTCKMGFFWLQEALLLLTPYKITFFFCRICLNGKHRGNTNLCSVFLFCRELMSRKAGGDTGVRDRCQSSSHSSWSGQRLPRLVPQQWISLPGVCSLCIMQDEQRKPDNLAWDAAVVNKLSRIKIFKRHKSHNPP